MNSRMESCMSDTGETHKSNTPAYSPGLEGVIAGESALCQVDEGEQGLGYRGYALSDRGEQATFEKVAYLLLYRKLAISKELEDFYAPSHAMALARPGRGIYRGRAARR